MAAKILVSGLINIETTMKTDGFPIEYSPVRYPFHGVEATISGVGYNLAKAFTVLGNELLFQSVIGKDLSRLMIYESLKCDQIEANNVLELMDQTARSVIIYDSSGRRQINVDLKDIQQVEYPLDIFQQNLAQADILALCNINFNRPMLAEAVRSSKPIATDLHTMSALDHDYDQEFLQSASIVFLSDEQLPCPPDEFASELISRFNTQIVGVGLGSKGAVLAVRDTGKIHHVPAVQTREIVNTIGAGDALFSAFIHEYARSKDPVQAMQKAVVFASWKIGEKSASEGFPNAVELDELYRQTSGNVS